MKIVVLDGATLTAHQYGQNCPANEPNWQTFEALGELTVYDRTMPNQVIPRLQDADVAITNKTLITDEMIAASKKLQYIGLLSTGTNSVDLAAAANAKIPVCNIPGYSTESVVQHTFALLLGLSQHLQGHNQAVHNGQWQSHPDFCFTVAPITELAGKTMAIYGLGAIGQGVAKVAHSLGMRIIAKSNRKPDIGIPVEFVDTDSLFTKADVLCPCCPLTEDTTHLINAQRLQNMQPHALLINCARGGIVDQQALADALKKGTIAGAGLDVLANEPPLADNPLIGLPNCIITPHIAWASCEARNRCLAICAKNLEQWQNNQIQNQVN